MKVPAKILNHHVNRLNNVTVFCIFMKFDGGWLFILVVITSLQLLFTTVYEKKCNVRKQEGHFLNYIFDDSISRIDKNITTLKEIPTFCSTAFHLKPPLFICQCSQFQLYLKFLYLNLLNIHLLKEKLIFQPTIGFCSLILA